MHTMRGRVLATAGARVVDALRPPTVATSAVRDWVGARLVRGGSRQPAALSRMVTKSLLSRDLRQLFAARGIDCVLDVGAHYGEYAYFLRRAVGYEGRIVSFEPSPRSYRRLETRAQHDRDWLTRPFALGDADTTMELRLGGSSVFDSLLPANGYSTRVFGRESAAEETVAVPVRRLDACIDSLTSGLAAPRLFLKTDAQGYDLQVFAGAAGALQMIEALQVELSARPIYEGAPSLVDALERYAAAGYEPYSFYEVVRDQADGGAIEFDCLLVR